MDQESILAQASADDVLYSPVEIASATTETVGSVSAALETASESFSAVPVAATNVLLDGNVLSGDLAYSWILILIALGFITALAALRAAFKGERKEKSRPREASESNQAQGYPVAGKLERIDQTLSEFRTETLRALEILRSEIEELRPAGAGEKKKEKFREPLDSAIPERLAAVDVPTSAEREPFAISPDEREQPAEPETGAVIQRGAAQVDNSLTARLKATRRGIFAKIRSVFSGKPALDDEMVEELRALLIGADLGATTVDSVIGLAKSQLSRGDKIDESQFRELVQGHLREILERNAPVPPVVTPTQVDGKPKIVLVVGVNGAGKTTTVAKLAHQWKEEGARVLLVAADTFRAAAVAQLSEWASRLSLPVVTGADNAKPQTVVFEAMQRLETEQFDVVLIDTAGRLQTKINLMQELEGVRNAISRHVAGAPHETLLVVDGSTGQNAISQAREFNDAVSLTGLIVTKLDGTSKGGVVVAIKEAFGIPVRYIGVGEAPQDLRPFVPSGFVEAIFDSSDDALSEGASNILAMAPVLDGSGGLGAEGASFAHAEQRRRRRAAGQ